MERGKLGLEKAVLRWIKRLERDVLEIFKVSETYAELKKNTAGSPKTQNLKGVKLFLKYPSVRALL